MESNPQQLNYKLVGCGYLQDNQSSFLTKTKYWPPSGIRERNRSKKLRDLNSGGKYKQYRFFISRNSELLRSSLIIDAFDINSAS